METEGPYPKKVCVSVWGDKMPSQALNPGSLLKIDFDVESREFNGRWYTDVKAWKIEVAGAGDAPPAADAQVSDEPSDLPF